MIGWTASEMTALAQTARAVGARPADLLGCIYFETGGTLDPTIENPLSGAYGLIQWTKAAYDISGIKSRADLPPTVKGQLPFVQKYLQHFRDKNGAVYENLGDIYQAIFAPAYFPQRSNNIVYYRSPSAGYEQNKGFDVTNKGYITRSDTVRRIKASLETQPNFTTALTLLQATIFNGDQPTFGAGIDPYSPKPYGSGNITSAKVLQASFGTVLMPLALIGGVYWWIRRRGR